MSKTLVVSGGTVYSLALTPSKHIATGAQTSVEVLCPGSGCQPWDEEDGELSEDPFQSSIVAPYGARKVVATASNKIVAVPSGLFPMLPVIKR